MIYNGLYFRLKLINDELPNDQKVKGLYGLKTYEYSEQYALDTLLREIFGKRYFQKSGKELDELMDGAPDYYIRNGKRAMLFESKDILISKESKTSPDYTVLEAELRLKLFENEKGKPKAVRQLATNIEILLKGKADYDSQKSFLRKKVLSGRYWLYIIECLTQQEQMPFSTVGFGMNLSNWKKMV